MLNLFFSIDVLVHISCTIIYFCACVVIPQYCTLESTLLWELIFKYSHQWIQNNTEYRTSTRLSMSTTFKFQMSHIPRTLAPSHNNVIVSQQIRTPKKQDCCYKLLSKPHKLALKSCTRTQSRTPSQIWRSLLFCLLHVIIWNENSSSSVELNVFLRIFMTIETGHKGTGHNKFVWIGPTLSGVGGYQRHHLSREHYRQTFIGFNIWVDTEMFS